MKASFLGGLKAGQFLRDYWQKKPLLVRNAFPGLDPPFSPADVVVRRTPLCSPCHRRRCSLHEGAMEAITSIEVLRAVDRRLPRAEPPVSEGAKRAAV